MEGKNNALVSLNDESKETLKDRLVMLIGDRSVRAAAKDWNMSVSTLNNYLKRGTEPALNVINHVAKIERVSLDWLANGNENQNSDAKTLPQSNDQTPVSTLKYKWLMILDSIDLDDAESLIKAIHRKGVTSLIEDNRPSKSVEDVIDSLDIRFTLKQAIKEALKGDEKLDQEILRRIENRKNTDVSGQLIQNENHSKVG
ncbi:hypothetical protein LV777_10190 [Providencia rettgeri]|uniref:hypothetical protein n=1 Tax=Providencia rettgeri TaxID=587 RepID=UPI002046062F|nr:hypothetical protein LV777_10190 [Providencia rettgeri]